MFVLSELEDSVEIKASSQDREKILFKKLNLKYANRLAGDLGLCIFVHEITEILDYEIKNELLIAGVRFTVVFLRFYSDEVCAGVIVRQEEEKIVISDGLFNSYECQALDIFENSEYESEDRHHRWVWNYKGNRLIFHVGDLVLFRIKKLRHEDFCVEVCMNEQGLGPKIWWE